MSLRPTAGARYLLERTDVTDDMASAGYRAAIYTPDAEFEYALRLAVDAPPELTDAGVRAGDALEAQLIAIAKQVARQAGKRRSESAPPWPRRVLRWKGPGRGGR